MAKDKFSPGLSDILGFITQIQEERESQEKKSKQIIKKIKKRGRPKIYSDKVMTKVYFVMLSKGIKEFKALWRYLKDNPEVRKRCGLEKLPDRTTFSRRMKNFSPSSQE